MSKNRVNKEWTSREIKQLRKMAAQGISDYEMANKLGRTVGGIQSKKKQLGVITVSRSSNVETEKEKTVSKGWLIAGCIIGGIGIIGLFSDFVVGLILTLLGGGLIALWFYRQYRHDEKNAVEKEKVENETYE